MDSAVLLGTATDNPGGVGVSRVGVGIFDGNQYWNSAAFASPTPVFNIASFSEGAWSLPFAVANQTERHSYTVNSQAIDNAGNLENPGPRATFTIVAPTTITKITSTTPNGTYGLGDPRGDSINVTVTFSAPVTLAGGNLTVELSDGGTVSITPFANSMTASATFVVPAGLPDAIPLDTISPLTLAAGATLTDANGNNVVLTFTAAQSLMATSDIVVKAYDSQKLGAYRSSNGSWSLDSDGTTGFSATDQVFFSFSPPNVTGVVGDWTGTGRTNIGDFSNGVWHLDLNGNGVLDAGETFQFGQAGDQPVVGDWDGNPSGRDELGVFRANPDGSGSGIFILDIADHHTIDSSCETFTFGLATDHVIVGDWTGTGKTKVGVYRDAVNYIPADAGDIVFSENTSDTDTTVFTNFVFGLITDHVVIGDWNGSGTAKVAVYRDASTVPVGTLVLSYAPWVRAIFLLDFANGNLQFDPGVDQVFLFGLTTDQFVTGNWVVTPPLQPVGTPQRAQFAAGGVGPGNVAALTNAELQPVLSQAIADWAAAGANVSALQNVNVQIGALNDNLIGWTSGNTITLDPTADGWGWSTGGTPQTGKMDLDTVLAHELGHVLGLPDEAWQSDDLMYEWLATGIRKAPTTQDVEALSFIR